MSIFRNDTLGSWTRGGQAIDDLVGSGFYRAAGRLEPDWPLREAAAGCADLLLQAGAKPSTAPKSSWNTVLQRVAEAAGRRLKDDGSGFGGTLREVRKIIAGSSSTETQRTLRDRPP